MNKVYRSLRLNNVNRHWKKCSCYSQKMREMIFQLLKAEIRREFKHAQAYSFDVIADQVLFTLMFFFISGVIHLLVQGAYTDVAILVALIGFVTWRVADGCILGVIDNISEDAVVLLYRHREAIPSFDIRYWTFCGSIFTPIQTPPTNQTNKPIEPTKPVKPHKCRSGCERSEFPDNPLFNDISAIFSLLYCMYWNRGSHDSNAIGSS